LARKFAGCDARGVRIAPGPAHSAPQKLLRAAETARAAVRAGERPASACGATHQARRSEWTQPSRPRIFTRTLPWSRQWNGEQKPRSCRFGVSAFCEADRVPAAEKALTVAMRGTSSYTAATPYGTRQAIQ
jgi:hypothetical protein